MPYNSRTERDGMAHAEWRTGRLSCAIHLLFMGHRITHRQHNSIPEPEKRVLFVDPSTRITSTHHTRTRTQTYIHRQTHIVDARHRCAAPVCALWGPIHPIQLNELRLLAVRIARARATDARVETEWRASTRVSVSKHSRTHTHTHTLASQ